MGKLYLVRTSEFKHYRCCHAYTICGKILDREKLANLVNRMSFTNILSANYFFLQSTVTIHVAHSPVFYHSNWLGLAHSPIFYFAKIFTLTLSSYMQCNSMACVFMCLGSQKNNSINFTNSRHIMLINGMFTLLFTHVKYIINPEDTNLLPY